MANFSGAALFVVATAGSLNTADTEMKDRLIALGFTVTEKSDDDVFLDTDSNWVTGFDVAVVSESISSTVLGTSGRDAVQGTVFIEGGGIDDWDLATNSANDVDVGVKKDHLEVSAAHFLSAGLAGTGNDFEVIQVTLDKQMRHVDTPSSGAVAIFSSNNKTHHITSWLLGATLTTGTAAERRVFLGNFRIDVDVPPDEDTDGFALNDLGWATFDAAVDWCANNSLTTDRQLAFPVAEITRTGGWSANAVTDIDDEVPSTSASYNSGTSDGVLVFRLGTLTDPANDKLHVLAVAHRRSAGASDTISATIGIHRNYVSEGSQGTIVQPVTTINSTSGIDASGLNWGGTIIDLTTTEADTIAASEYTDDLYVRVAFTANSTGAIEIANIRFLVDGGAAVAAPVIRRRQLTTVRM